MEKSTQIYRNMDDQTPIKKIDEKSSSATIRMIRFLMSKYDFKNNMVLNEVFAKEKEGKKYHPDKRDTVPRWQRSIPFCLQILSQKQILS